MTTIAEARNKIGIAPVYLVEITLLGTSPPTLYFSDRNITVSGQIYEDYIQEISGISEELKLVDSSGLSSDVSIVFKNDKYKTHDYLIEIGKTYPFSGASCTIKECLLDSDGNPSDVETIFVGACEEPSNINLLSFTCSISDKVIDKDERFVQKTFTTSDYPNVSLTATGRRINTVGYGSPKRIRASGIVSGACSFLEEDITETDTTLTVNDALRYPSPPFMIQIEHEHMWVTGVASNVFTVTRAYNKTEAELHYAGQNVFEVLTEYVYHLFDYPVDSIGKVYIDGREQYEGFTAYTGRTGDEHPDWPGKAVIVFSTDNYVGKQRNLIDEEGRSKEEPSTKVIYPDIFPLDQTFAPVSVSFPDKDYGTITKQSYYITINHYDAEVPYITFKVAISNKSNQRLLKLVEMGNIEQQYTGGSFTIEHEGGEWGTIVTLFPVGTSNDDPRLCPVTFGSVYKTVSYFPPIR